MRPSDQQVRHDHPPFVVAVVLTTNESEDAIKCVRSLLSSEYPSLHIIVVDNASTDGGPEKIEKMFPSVSVIRRTSNEGYSAGNNTGIRVALEQGADYVLISNSDIVVEKDFLQPLVTIAEEQRNAGLVIGTIKYQSHPDQIYYAAGQISWLRCTGMNTSYRTSSAVLQDSDVDVNFVNGALFLVRRKVFEELGLFDERFFLYYDDLEFSRRCLTRFRLIYTPKSVAYHKSGAGKGIRSYSESYLYYSARNRFWVFQHDSIWYRSYVFFYSLVNTLAKAAFLCTNIMNDRSKVLRQLSAVFRGFRDGILTRPKI